jgi:tetratricopeptide (TPR) repeat protein
VWVTEGLEPSRSEPFKQTARIGPSETFSGEIFPELIETWLLAPISVPSLKTTPGLFTIADEQSIPEDVAAIYNLLFRTLFDRHRDLPLPTSFLIDERGRIVKVYQGIVSQEQAQRDLKLIPQTDAERIAKALPFPGVSHSYEFGRNYLSLGSIFFQRGYLDAAGDFFTAAPESAEALYGLGSIYLKQDKNALARDCFERAVKLKSGYPETLPNAWNNLGILATREADTDKAIGYFERALALDQDHFVALENLGNAYRQQMRWEAAQATLTRALALKPDDPEANYSVAMVLAQNNDNAGAYEHLLKALRERPIYPEALNNLGILFLRTGRRDEAVAHFEQCIRVAPEFDQSYLNLARVYAIEGAVDKARAVLQALLAQHPNHPAALQALEQLH